MEFTVKKLITLIFIIIRQKTMEEKPENGDREDLPQKGNMMIWIAIAVVIVVAGIIYFSLGGKKPTAPNAATPSTNISTSPTDDASTKVFDISGKPFEYSIVT